MTASIHKIVYAAFLLLAPALVPATRAQDLAADLEHIKSVLKGSPSLLLEMQASIDYTDAMNKDQDLPESIRTTIKIGNGMYFYQNEMLSMVINKEWVVGVMHGQKQIVYGRNNSRELEMARKKALEKDVPTDPRLVAKATFVGETDGIKHYRIPNPGNGLRMIEMYISRATGFFTRLVNEYADPSQTGVIRTVTEFKHFDAKASFSPDDFSEKMFLRLTGTTAQPVEKLKAYQVLYTDPELLNNF